MNFNEELKENINSFHSDKEPISGHFNTDVIDLGNNKYGVDIFCLSTRKAGNFKYIYFDGIYKHGVVNLLKEYGVCFKKIHDAFIIVRIEGNVIYEISMKEIKDLVNEYLLQLPPLILSIDGVEAEFTTKAQIEKFYRQTNMVMNDKFLEYLIKDESIIITDTPEDSFLFFSNKIVQISSKGVEERSFDKIENEVVWKSAIIDFDLKEPDNSVSHFEKFVSNVCNQDEKRILALKSAIGYLMHNYNKKSGGQMILLYDQSIADLSNPQGGTGKGLIANSVRLLRSTAKMDGKKFKGNSAFDFQEVSVDTQIVWLDDAGKDLDIDRFNSISTDGFNIEKKFKDAIHIPPESSPKILICSNIILNCTGTTRKRRQFIIELSNHYSSQICTGTEEPIVQEHGCRFFSEEWDDVEWNQFYWFMIKCSELYMSRGLIHVPAINLIENRARQIMGDEFFNWIKKKDLKPDFEYSTTDFFEEFKSVFENGNDKFTQRRFSNNLKKYAALSDQTILFEAKNIGGSKKGFFTIIS